MGKGRLKAIFTKKEGGTLLGNLVRSAGDKFTGGLVSQLLPKPTAEDVNAQQVRRGGVKAYKSAIEQPQKEIVIGNDGIVITKEPTAEQVATKKRNTIIGVVVGVVVLVIAFFSMRKKK
ncbi:MAG: hypothetical protein ACK5B9_00825 [Flavobacteriia bacterium]|jgi:hypothetical protein